MTVPGCYSLSLGMFLRSRAKFEVTPGVAWRRHLSSQLRWASHGADPCGGGNICCNRTLGKDRIPRCADHRPWFRSRNTRQSRCVRTDFHRRRPPREPGQFRSRSFFNSSTGTQAISGGDENWANIGRLPRFIVAQVSSQFRMAICACFPPKVHDGTPAPWCRTCFRTLRYNELGCDAEGHLNAPVEARASILAALSGSELRSAHLKFSPILSE
jgi:hypothetical protein